MYIEKRLQDPGRTDPLTDERLEVSALMPVTVSEARSCEECKAHNGAILCKKCDAVVCSKDRGRCVTGKCTICDFFGADIALRAQSAKRVDAEVEAMLASR